jgi:cellulose synthase/poly-beta-1,6-N-acetylglucosamine synthase-like glycosyltransferase
MDSRPDISILIPCHNEEDGIESTVCNLLKKTRPDWNLFRNLVCKQYQHRSNPNACWQQLAETYEQLWYV